MAPTDTCDKHVYPATLIYRTNILLPAPQMTYKSISTLDLACHCNNVAQVSPCTTLHNIYECVLIFWYVVWSCVVLSSLTKMKYYFMFSVLFFAVCVLVRAFRPDLWTHECRLQTSVPTRYYGISSGNKKPNRKLPLRKSDTDLFNNFAKQRASLFSVLYSRDMVELPSLAPLN